MIMNKCKDYFNPDLIFAFDNRSPIIEFGIIINDPENTALDWVNPKLKELFAHDSEGGASGKGDNLSLEYLLNRQDRISSPFFERLKDHYLSNDQQSESQNQIDLSHRIALLMITKFLTNWSKLADAMFADYNPIDNYNMVENRKTDFEEHTVTDSSEKTTNKYSGFNTDEMKNVSESESEGDIDTTKTDSGSSANNELTRRGNIGVTTSAQMIEGEIKLRQKNLIDVIYKDIDTLLFIDYYC